ncbi:MAG: GTP cyclohydrolase I FolE [Micrococcaceae bacterium]
MDLERIEAAVSEILEAIGEDPKRTGLKDTPKRVADTYAEIFAGIAQNPADLFNESFEDRHEELVIVRDIPLHSTCEHHLIPFHGVAHIGYIPGKEGKIAGLSKLARLVDIYAKRPQIQERMTTEIAESLVEHLQASGVIVVLECEHLCISMRGIKKAGAQTVTSAVRGTLRNPATRSEAMTLIFHSN